MCQKSIRTLTLVCSSHIVPVCYTDLKGCACHTYRSVLFTLTLPSDGVLVTLHVALNFKFEQAEMCALNGDDNAARQDED